MFILDTAETMKGVLSKKNKRIPHLQGKSVIMLFFEESTRTKMSYKLAAQYLSADVADLQLPPDADEVGGLVNIGKMIEQMGADYIVIRHWAAGSARVLAENISASVINAGDGKNENPSQALLDLMTINEAKVKAEGKKFSDLKVTIVGDIANSRAGKSNILGLTTLGAEVSVCAPPTLVPPFIGSCRGVKVYHDVNKAVKDSDVIISLRLGKEEQYEKLLPSFNEYSRFFMISESVLQNAKPDAIVLHPPGKIDADTVLSANVFNLQRCLVDDQISNGIAVRMALYYLLSLAGGDS